MSSPEKIRLGEILVQQSLLTQDQFEYCLIEHNKCGRRIGQVCIETGFVTEDAICRALSRQLNIPYINLKAYHLNPLVVRTLKVLWSCGNSNWLEVSSSWS